MKKKETAEEIETRLRTLSEQSNDAILVYGLDGRIIDANKKAAEMTGYKKKELLGMNVSKLRANKEKIFSKALKKLKNGDNASFEDIFVTRNKRLVPAEIDARIIRREGEYVIREVAKDISKEEALKNKVAERENKLKEKIEELKDKEARLKKTTRALTNMLKDTEKEREASEEKAGELAEEEQKIKDSRTALLNMMKDLNEQMGRLKELDEMKVRFFSMTSHELKTPITPMKMQLEMLMGGDLGKLSDKQKQGLDIVLRNALRLEGLLNDLLDISRIESKGMQFKYKKVDVNSLVKQAVQTMHETAKNKKINLAVKQGKIPNTMCDPDRIQQVLINLLSNSLKFTPENGTITIRTEKEDHDVKVSVSDNGIGIPEKHLPKIFSAFYQVEQPATKKYKGTGLGLTICKAIVEAHNGTIWVKSPGAGKGTIFTFTLPVKVKPEEAKKDEKRRD